MQIAILFIYNHCQVRNNIYLWSNFCQSLPFLFCHSSEITDNRKNTLRRFDKRASERSQSSERWGAKIRLSYPGTFRYRKLKFLFSPTRRKVRKIRSDEIKLHLVTNFIAHFFSWYRSETLAASSSTLWINFSTHKVKKLANIGDDYVHCVNDE